MPNSNLDNQSPDLIGEACAWIAQLETGEMSQADMRAFKEWIGRSPAHFSEIKRLARLSADTNALSEIAQSLSTATREHRQTVSKKRFGGGNLRTAMMTCAALIVFAVIGIRSFNANQFEEPYLIATVVGGFNETTLSDGSIVKLNTNSEIEVDYDPDLRRIRLIKGEAAFDVAHNPDRPFQVYIGDKIVRAVGTAFTVRWTDGDLSITVSEGRVAFAPSGEQAEPFTVFETVPEQSTPKEIKVASLETPLFLDAGQKVKLSKDNEPTLVASIEERYLKSQMAWQVGMWDFTDRPLVEIIDEMSRHSDLQIEFAEDDLREIKYTGIFRTDEIDALLNALDRDSEIEVERVDEKHVRIKPE